MVAIGTNEFFPSSCVSLQTHRQFHPYRHQRLGRRNQAECSLSSSFPLRRDPFPPVFVMEAAENRVSQDLAVLGEGMPALTLQR